MTHVTALTSPPAKPVMIYDGNCEFCRFWVFGWQHVTAGQVEYLAAQDESVARRFPELTGEQLARAVQLIETDGQVYSAAEAVFRALAHTRHWAWTLWIYRRVPGVRPVTEWAYRWVANHRQVFLFWTRLFSGPAKG